jgi:hypothetical protein
LALAGDQGWADYRLSVALGSYPVLGDTVNEIGVVFRYRDTDNYYWFTINYQSSTLLLLRRAGGQTTVLWQQSASSNLGQAYHLDIDCLEQSLRGYLDGQLLFDVADAAVSSGRVGLACTANRAAFFTDVRVISPIWRLYHSFREEERLPAGSRLRVHSGSQSAPPPDTVGMIYRFTAGLGQPGRLHFAADGVDVRLRSAGGDLDHMRRFLPATIYSASGMQDWRALRKADGTGFFLLKLKPSMTPPEVSLPTGQYRLELSFRRDNRTADPDSQVLSEAGDTGAETVTIDIPWQTRNV